MALTESTIPEESIRLREYVGVLLRRKWSIIAITLLAVLAALFYAQRQTPMFQATSRVQATITLALNPSQSNNVGGPNMDTESEIVGSDTVTKCTSVILNDPTF